MGRIIKIYASTAPLIFLFYSSSYSSAFHENSFNLCSNSNSLQTQSILPPSRTTTKIVLSIPVLPNKLRLNSFSQPFMFLDRLEKKRRKNIESRPCKVWMFHILLFGKHTCTRIPSSEVAIKKIKRLQQLLQLFFFQNLVFHFPFPRFLLRPFPLRTIWNMCRSCRENSFGGIATN